MQALHSALHDDCVIGHQPACHTAVASLCRLQRTKQPAAEALWGLDQICPGWLVAGMLRCRCWQAPTACEHTHTIHDMGCTVGGPYTCSGGCDNLSHGRLTQRLTTVQVSWQWMASYPILELNPASRAAAAQGWPNAPRTCVCSCNCPHKKTVTAASGRSWACYNSSEQANGTWLYYHIWPDACLQHLCSSNSPQFSCRVQG